MLKSYYLYLQFGVEFDLLIHSKIVPIVSFFNQGKIEATVKRKASLENNIQKLHKELQSKHPTMEKWLHELFFTNEIAVLCRKEMAPLDFIKEQLALIGFSEHHIHEKLRGLENKARQPDAARKLLHVEHESIKLNIDPADQAVPMDVLIFELPIDGFFSNNPNILHFIHAMVDSKSTFFPCVVGSQARYASSPSNFFNEEKDLDFEVLQCELSDAELMNLTQLESRAHQWLLSLSSNNPYTNPPQSFKSGCCFGMNFSWCSFKAKMGRVEFDFRFLFTSKPLAEIIAFSRKERCLNWTSYLWDLKNVRFYSPSLQHEGELGFIKPINELTFNNLSYALWKVACVPPCQVSEHFSRIIKAVVGQYQTDHAFKEALAASFGVNFGPKMQDDSRLTLEGVMAAITNKFFPLSQQGTFFNPRTSKQAGQSHFSVDSQLVGTHRDIVSPD